MSSIVSRALGAQTELDFVGEDIEQHARRACHFTLLTHREREALKGGVSLTAELNSWQ